MVQLQRWVDDSSNRNSETVSFWSKRRCACRYGYCIMGGWRLPSGEAENDNEPPTKTLHVLAPTSWIHKQVLQISEISPTVPSLLQLFQWIQSRPWNPRLSLPSKSSLSQCLDSCLVARWKLNWFCIRMESESSPNSPIASLPEAETYWGLIFSCLKTKKFFIQEGDFILCFEFRSYYQLVEIWVWLECMDFWVQTSMQLVTENRTAFYFWKQKIWKQSRVCVRKSLFGKQFLRNGFKNGVAFLKDACKTLTWGWISWIIRTLEYLL